jgi:hypothetical protein
MKAKSVTSIMSYNYESQMRIKRQKVNHLGLFKALELGTTGIVA